MGRRGGRTTARSPGSHADPSLRNRGPRRRPLSRRRRDVRGQRRARQMACRGLWRRPVDVAAHDRRGRRARAAGPVAARQTDRSAPTRASGSARPVRGGGHFRLLLRDALYAARRRHDLLYGDAAHHHGAIGAAARRKGRALSLDRRPGRLRWRPHCAQAFAADAVLGRADRAIRSDRLCAEPDDHPRSPGHPLGPARSLAIRRHGSCRRGDHSLGVDDAQSL